MRIQDLLLAITATTALALGQTTGVTGINDYTINGSACSGSPSCTSCCFSTPVTLNCNVATAPGNAAIFFWSFCPCTAGFICGPVNSCVPAIPSTACGSTTNQSFDVLLGCVNFTVIAFSNTAGIANLTLNIPNLGPAPPCSIGPLATQVVVIDTCGLGVTGFPGPFVLTQGYSVSFN
jgi:hypothetical protein